jgi:hypothetical protein
LLLVLSLPALTASHATTVTLYGGAFGETPVADSSAAPLEPDQAISIGTFAEGFDPSRILDFGLFTSDNTTTPWVFPAADTQNGSADNHLLIGTGQINVALDGDFLLADPRDPASPATALRLTPSAPRENE